MDSSTYDAQVNISGISPAYWGVGFDNPPLDLTVQRSSPSGELEPR